MSEIISGEVVAIFIAPASGEPMQLVKKARALIGKGLEGDRYASGNGSFNKGNVGKRQVSLISAEAFLGTQFLYEESRRNIIVRGMELPRLINEFFTVGGILMRGVKYNYVCNRPSYLVGKEDFKVMLFERGGIIAEVWDDGEIGIRGEVLRVERPMPKHEELVS